MICYHGTPMGGSNINKSKFFMGRHALVSFANTGDIGIMSSTCSSFVIDNGAFTVWKKGGVLDIEGYTEFIESLKFHPSFDWALIPDVIDGSEEENDTLIDEWTIDDRISVPVWHLGESLGRLSHLSERFNRIALGSSGEYRQPLTSIWFDRMDEIMNFICDKDGRPTVKMHGLRMLAPQILERYPLSSADSTSAGLCSMLEGRFGTYVPPSRWQRAVVIADRIESVLPPPVWTNKQQDNFTLNFKE